ncbi:MAG: phenylalanine--tRNA ligase subunit beta [Gammaproteobacteria bacterium]|nr:phenylalanine--tRNA ligase subunit beta [Gammaproteobacteria bacterium]
MKISELWLREWIDSSLTRDVFCERMTMAGLEIESISPVAGEFSDVVVAHVEKVEPHPEADRLQICTVDSGDGSPVMVVCGAKNVFAGMKAALAKEGAVLPGGLKIRRTKLRGVASHGMLCSPVELGLSEESAGLLVLPADAPIGQSVKEYLQLNDHIIEISVTPNRGDCLSVLGIAHEIAALTNTTVRSPTFNKMPDTSQDTFSVTVQAVEQCPHYVGRVIRQINASAITPLWLQERLRRSGMRCIHPVVDVMNYVMLELGQPMHAFDLATLSGGITVRLANAGEQIALLDERTVTLQSETLVIADQKGPQAIAGVMGGSLSGVSTSTQDIFLESAFFQPITIARAVREYQAASESSHRFERGVDPALQIKAIERATELVLAIAGGNAGPMVAVQQENYIPTQKTITLRRDRIQKIIGTSVADADTQRILSNLGFQLKNISNGWEVIVPPRRFDVKAEIDLIEEIIRIYGYEKVPLTKSVVELHSHTLAAEAQSTNAFTKILIDQGYHEVVTYSFIDEKLQRHFNPNQQPIPLVNPISSEMSVMRTSIWPGLLNVLQYNLNRQQSRVRIFEVGTCFVGSEETQVLSALVSGGLFPLQWGMKDRVVDFFDVKGDIENLFTLTGYSGALTYQASKHPALHPGQSADIYHGDQYLGVFGLLHPSLAKTFDMDGKVYLFELPLKSLQFTNIPQFREISKFPAIRRDIAILLEDTVPAKHIQDTISKVAGPLLQSVTVFDVYQGKGIPSGKKSMAFALVLQHASQTLTDETVADLMQRVITALQDSYAAELRSST